jgi:putative ABC transport system permease protein
MALGAQPPDVLKMVIRQGMLPVLWGALIGAVLSLALTPLLDKLLYGVRPADPSTFVICCVFLSLAGLMACYIPARRATRVDPMVAMRYE